MNLRSGVSPRRRKEPLGDSLAACPNTGFRSLAIKVRPARTYSCQQSGKNPDKLRFARNQRTPRKRPARNYSKTRSKSHPQHWPFPWHSLLENSSSYTPFRTTSPHETRRLERLRVGSLTCSQRTHPYIEGRLSNPTLRNRKNFVLACWHVRLGDADLRSSVSPRRWSSTTAVLRCLKSRGAVASDCFVGA